MVNAEETWRVTSFVKANGDKPIRHVSYHPTEEQAKLRATCRENRGHTEVAVKGFREIPQKGSCGQ